MSDLEKVKKIINDHRLYTKNFLKIKTKSGELKPFIYNNPQTKFDRIWQKQVELGKPVRLLVLKARQEGISTYTEGRAYYYAATKKNRNVKIVAHEDEGTNNLFGMSKTFHENVPKSIEIEDKQLINIRPKEKYSNRKELIFEDTGSQITMKTAGSDSEEKGSGVGRSQTIHFLHGSEVAFWPAAKQTLTALLQTVPDLPDTVVVLESTANGVGDYFYTLWQKAKAGEIDFIPVFLSWMEMEEYKIPLVHGESLLPYDEEELRLRELYDVSDAKLKWRRQTIRSKCQGDIEQFHQEYPSDDREAFIVSGRPFFVQKNLIEFKKDFQSEPIRIGDLEWDDPDNAEESGVHFVDNPKGLIWAWEEPKPFGCYCIGGDVAEGLEKGDYSSLDVLDRDNFTQIAQWHGHIDPDLLGIEAVKLAKWYNKAWIGIEVNNHGLVTNKAILRLNYFRIFQRQIMDEQVPAETDKVGWRTDTLTRPLMLDDLKKAMRDGLVIQSEKTISECITFTCNAKGKPEAAGDCHDDTVMSMAITVQVHKLCPMSRPKPKTMSTIHARDVHVRNKPTKNKPSSRVTGY